ncbi:glucan endo-1,3-beta-D-glucosidase [Capsicum annuum]|nr:glucan endo-1,3-beta-D-glucosidase [Capsicum annuum]
MLHLFTHFLCKIQENFSLFFSVSQQVQEHSLLTMAKATCILLLLLSHVLVGTLVLANEQKTWCVAKPSSDSKTLEENINYACSQVDCRILQKGCTCSSPDNLMNHASIAMNLYYQAKGRNHWNCHFGNSALIVLTDPSYGSCIYE